MFDPKEAAVGSATADTGAASTRERLGILTEDDLAAALGLQKQTLAVWRGEKVGPSYTKLGKSVFYRYYDVVCWIDAKTVPMEGYRCTVSAASAAKAIVDRVAGHLRDQGFDVDVESMDGDDGGAVDGGIDIGADVTPKGRVQ